MSNSLNPVFGEWYTDKQLGTGTDGKVFSIYRVKPDGTKETSILKIIRLGENRNERKLLSPNMNADFNSEKEDEKFDSIIKDIKRNINTVRKLDGGKRFVKYEDFELRTASDGKGKLILIRLEEMKSLSQLLDEFSFTLEETVRLGISICRSLMKCRTFNYIYPNLKPENILFDRNGICKLGDFGSFSCLEPSKTAIAYKRTQYYMAPEFIKTGNVNCTVDTYSLGLILYMLSNRGRLPFTEPYPQKLTVNSLNEATVKRVAGDKFTKPALCSDELWRIISKACSYNVNDRYFTPDQMHSDLKSVLYNKPFETPQYSDVYSARNEADDSSTEVLIPTLEETSAPSMSDLPLESEWIAPDLKNEIQIPNATPIYKRPKAKKSPTNYAKLPEIKKPKKKDIDSIKRLIIIAAVTLLLIILFVVSLSMRLSGDNEDTITTLMCFAVNNYYGNFTLLI